MTEFERKRRELAELIEDISEEFYSDPTDCDYSIYVADKLIAAGYGKRVLPEQEKSCKTCEYYTPVPNYRDGKMGNCRYLEKIWEKPYYVNQARTECDHYNPNAANGGKHGQA